MWIKLKNTHISCKWWACQIFATSCYCCIQRSHPLTHRECWCLTCRVRSGGVCDVTDGLKASITDRLNHLSLTKQATLGKQRQKNKTGRLLLVVTDAHHTHTDNVSTLLLWEHLLLVAVGFVVALQPDVYEVRRRVDLTHLSGHEQCRRSAPVNTLRGGC